MIIQKNCDVKFVPSELTPVILGAFMSLVLTGGCQTVAPEMAGTPGVSDSSSRYLLPGPHQVVENSAELIDPTRSRDIPTRVYSPVGFETAPVVIFSHGMGESRDAYVYLGRHLASHGYHSIHLTHRGSDRAVLEKGWLAIYRAAKNPETWKNRPLDVSFIITELTASRIPAVERAASFDTTRIAVAGHSAGAYTALALAGMIILGDVTYRDERVKAAVAMSMPDLGSVLHANAFSNIAVPVLHITGTRDYSLIYGTTPRHRRIPFDRTVASNQYLITFPAVTHNTFSNPERAERKRESQQHKAIAGATTAFLDFHLREDAAAGLWLTKELALLPARVEVK